jgi:hypothetical protein
MGYPSDLTNVSYYARAWTQPNLVSYMESHDEERVMYKTLMFGNASGDYDTKNISTALKRMELDALFFLTVPGPKMIWQFGELGYDISIDQGGRTGEKPILWDYFSETKRYRLYRFYKVLNTLKKTQSVFQAGTTFTWSLSSTTKRMQMISDDNKAIVMGNFGLTDANINPAFPVAGKWYEYFSGDSVTISNINEPFLFKPGEYRLYTTSKMPSYKILLDVEEHPIHQNDKFVYAYPNPSSTGFSFIISDALPAPVAVKIFDVSGRLIRELETDITDSSIPVRWDGKNAGGTEAQSGLYLVSVKTGRRTDTIKVIKN